MLKRGDASPIWPTDTCRFTYNYRRGKNSAKPKSIEKTLTTIEKMDDTLGKQEPMKSWFQNFTWFHWLKSRHTHIPLLYRNYFFLLFTIAWFRDIENGAKNLVTERFLRNLQQLFRFAGWKNFRWSLDEMNFFVKRLFTFLQSN